LQTDLDAKSEKAAELDSLGAVIVELTPCAGPDDLAATLKKLPVLSTLARFHCLSLLFLHSQPHHHFD
jgi:hypothetical protein